MVVVSAVCNGVYWEADFPVCFVTEIITRQHWQTATRRRTIYQDIFILGIVFLLSWGDLYATLVALDIPRPVYQ